MFRPAFVFSATFRLVLSDWYPSVRKSWSGNTGAALTNPPSDAGPVPEEPCPPTGTPNTPVTRSPTAPMLPV